MARKQNTGEMEENEGLKPSLDINTNAEVAFKYILIPYLYKDDASVKRPSTVRSALRKAAIKDYGSENGAPTDKLWCPVVQDFFLAKRFKAAHIVLRIPSAFIDYTLKKGQVQE